MSTKVLGGRRRAPQILRALTDQPVRPRLPRPHRPRTVAAAPARRRGRQTGNRWSSWTWAWPDLGRHRGVIAGPAPAGPPCRINSCCPAPDRLRRTRCRRWDAGGADDYVPPSRSAWTKLLARLARRRPSLGPRPGGGRRWKAIVEDVVVHRRTWSAKEGPQRTVSRSNLTPTEWGLCWRSWSAKPGSAGFGAEKETASPGTSGGPGVRDGSPNYLRVYLGRNYAASWNANRPKPKHLLHRNQAWANTLRSLDPIRGLSAWWSSSWLL